MKIQNSFNSEKQKLYIVPTPIGNLEDMTFRAIKVLKSVDIIFAEDTRVSSVLLSHFEIKGKKVYSYHNHNEESQSLNIINLIKSGNNIAIISDAGIPLISDPGFRVVKDAIENEIDVITLPGANAALTALVSSGIVTQPFTFIGFLQSKGKQKQELKALANRNETLIFYVSPHKILNTLANIKEVLGNRNIVIARELTKKFEEYIRGTVDEVIKYLDKPRGEMVLIVEGNSDNDDFMDLSIKDHVTKYISDGHKTMDAIKMVARDRGTKKQEIYDEFHK